MQVCWHSWLACSSPHPGGQPHPLAPLLTPQRSQTARHRPLLDVAAAGTTGGTTAAGGGPPLTPGAAGTPKSCRFPIFELPDPSAASSTAAGSASGPPRSFHEAAERGDVAWLVRAIERTVDFDINQTDRTGRTALHWASECDRREAAATLLDFGISVTAVDGMGRTAVHTAARAAGADMLALLLGGLPDAQQAELVNAPDRCGITPVFLAHQRGEEGASAFEFLMGHGGRFNQQPADEAAAAAGSSSAAKA